MAAAASIPFEFSDGTVDVTRRRSGWLSGAAPLVLGLVGPLIAILLIDPLALRHARFLLVALLLPMLLIAVTMYIYYVLNPGNVAALSADPSAGVLVLARSNGLATRHTEIPFADIAKVHLAPQYDLDGYAVPGAELVLTDGERIELPAGMAEAEVAMLAHAIGRS